LYHRVAKISSSAIRGEILDRSIDFHNAIITFIAPFVLARESSLFLALFTATHLGNVLDPRGLPKENVAAQGCLQIRHPHAPRPSPSRGVIDSLQFARKTRVHANRTDRDEGEGRAAVVQRGSPRPKSPPEKIIASFTTAVQMEAIGS
jgi:hypothetical protein